MSPTWHLYLVRTRDGRLYTGIATDVERRLTEHAGGGARGAKALRGRGPLCLEYRRPIGDRALASRAETRIKRLARRDKERIVATRPSAARLLRELGLAGVDPLD